MSDWGAVNNRAKGVEAGLDLEMPSSNGVNDKKVVKAVKNGELDEKFVDKAATNILKIVDRYKYINDVKFGFDKKEHYDAKYQSKAICFQSNTLHLSCCKHT